MNSFRGIVKSAVFLGECIDCEVVIHDQAFNVKVPPELEISVGSQVNVLLPKELWVVMLSETVS